MESHRPGQPKWKVEINNIEQEESLQLQLIIRFEENIAKQFVNEIAHE
jgi:hypothetical protein